jgi:HAMP domain-containing protein
VAVVPLVLLGWFFSRAVTSPVRRLSEAVRHAGGRPVELPPLPRDEIGDLGEAIGDMSAQLHEDARALRAAVRFARHVAHAREPEAGRERLHRALAPALPSRRSIVVSAEELAADEVPDGWGHDAQQLRAVLWSEQESPPDERSGRRVAALGWAVLAGLLLLGVWIFAVAPYDRNMGFSQTILYIHVPSVWGAYLAFFVVFACSIAYLWKRDAAMDRVAKCSAEIGVMF